MPPSPNIGLNISFSDKMYEMWFTKNNKRPTIIPNIIIKIECCTRNNLTQKQAAVILAASGWHCDQKI